MDMSDARHNIFHVIKGKNSKHMRYGLASKLVDTVEHHR